MCIRDRGITKVWPEGTPGAFPIHDEEHIVCKDITKWRETVHAPRLDYSDAEWEPFIKEAEKIDRNEYFVTQFIAPGIFEQCHYLQEIQNALINFYEEPEYTQELIDYLTEDVYKRQNHACIKIYSRSLKFRRLPLSH